MIGREKRVVALEQYPSPRRATTTRFSTACAGRPLRQDLFRQDRRIVAAAAGEAHQRQDRPAFGRTIPTWPTRARSSIGCRSSESAPSSMSADALRRRGRRRSATRCSAISCRSPGTSTSTGSTTASGRIGRCARVPINVHADEFNEPMMGDEFIPLINKGGGAGLQVTAYTQTLSDIEARIGNRAKAGQVIGNNNLFMLRVRRRPRPNC